MAGPLKTRSAIHHITTALVLAACAVAAAAQNVDPAFAKFKSEMMPKVGQKISVVGTLYDGKQGFGLSFNDWGVDIYAINDSGMAKQNYLYAHFHKGQVVKVTGILRHFAEPPAPRKHRQDIQRPPEHFFFDAADVEMSVASQGH